MELDISEDLPKIGLLKNRERFIKYSKTNWKSKKLLGMILCFGAWGLSFSSVIFLVASCVWQSVSQTSHSYGSNWLKLSKKESMSNKPITHLIWSCTEGNIDPPLCVRTHSRAGTIQEMNGSPVAVTPTVSPHRSNRPDRSRLQALQRLGLP